jgi:hypothetical protein
MDNGVILELLVDLLVHTSGATCTGQPATLSQASRGIKPEPAESDRFNGKEDLLL